MYDWMISIIPKSTDDLLAWQASSAILYGTITVSLHLLRRIKLDITSVVKAVTSGGSLPVFVVLIFLPYQPSALALLSGATTKLCFCIAGLILTFLSIQSLFVSTAASSTPHITRP